MSLELMRRLKTLSGAGKLTVAAATALTTVVIAGPVSGAVCTDSLTNANKTTSQVIQFDTTRIKDGSLDIGASKVKVAGVSGEKQITYKCKNVLYRQIATEPIITKPIAEELLVGTKHDIAETASIPFNHQEVINNSLFDGQKRLRTAGVTGIRTLTYQVSQDEGQPEKKVLIKDEVTTAQIDEVYGVGPACSPHYSSCVPNVSYDINCVNIGYRTVRVIDDNDVYNLDGDGDGYGCNGYR